MRNIEHCNGTPSDLWGFHDSESDRSIPFKRYLYFWEKIILPPRQQSTCNHKLYFSHTSAIRSKLSKAPKTRRKYVKGKHEVKKQLN